jgi:AbiTii
MSALLDDIINLAVDGNQPLPDILRKCVLLGHDLKNERLKAWANQELNGYESDKGLPAYRIVPAEAKGNFVGPFHAQYLRHNIPPIALEKGHRGFAETMYLLQSVSAYADIINASKATHGSMALGWPANMVVYYQDKLIPGWICHSAWQEIPASALVEILDTIRNHALNMAIAIRDELGASSAGDAAKKIQRIVLQNTGSDGQAADTIPPVRQRRSRCRRRLLCCGRSRRGIEQNRTTQCCRKQCQSRIH